MTHPTEPQGETPRSTPRTTQFLEWMKRDFSYKAPEEHIEVMRGYIVHLSDISTEIETELETYKALDKYLPAGFTIGDDATADLVIKLVETERALSECRRELGEWKDEALARRNAAQERLASHAEREGPEIDKVPDICENLGRHQTDPAETLDRIFAGVGVCPRCGFNLPEPPAPSPTEGLAEELEGWAAHFSARNVLSPCDVLRRAAAALRSHQVEARRAKSKTTLGERG